MAEWTGDLVDILTLEKEVVSPPDWPSLLPHPAPPSAGLYTNYYVMRGFRHAHIPPDFETWIAVGLPNALNPSGEPIQDVSIQLTWFEINV